MFFKLDFGHQFHPNLMRQPGPDTSCENEQFVILVQNLLAHNNVLDNLFLFNLTMSIIESSFYYGR